MLTLVISKQSTVLTVTFKTS